jgi:hypothetical protein
MGGPDRGFSLDQARDPVPRTIWRGHPAGHTCRVLSRSSHGMRNLRRFVIPDNYLAFRLQRQGWCSLNIHRVAPEGHLWETVRMPKRKLRIVKETNGVPVLGVCEHCNKQFPAERHVVSQLAKARASIDQQFDAHACKREDVSQNAARIVREATENK